MKSPSNLNIKSTVKGIIIFNNVIGSIFIPLNIIFIIRIVKPVNNNNIFGTTIYSTSDNISIKISDTKTSEIIVSIEKPYTM